MRQSDRILVLDHDGFLGRALARRLAAEGAERVELLLTTDLDPVDPAMVDAAFASRRPHVVVLAAARTGGSLASATSPVDFLLDNLRIQTNVISAAWRYRARKLVLLSTPCIYPALAPEPVREATLLSGPPDPAREGEALARLAGIKLCQAYRRQYGFDAISLVMAAAYGPGMNCDPLEGHLLPALFRRIHEACLRGAPEVLVPVPGMARREFLHVDDLADAVVHLTRTHAGEEIVNVGAGEDISLRELAGLVARTVGYTGRVLVDPACVDYMPRRRLDVGRLRRLGWRHRIALQDGLAGTYRWFLEHEAGAPL